MLSDFAFFFTGPFAHNRNRNANYYLLCSHNKSLFSSVVSASIFKLFAPVRSGYVCASFSFAEAEESALPDNLADGSSVTVQAMQSDTGASRAMSVSSGGGIPAFTMTTNPDGSEDYSVTLQILALMTMLGGVGCYRPPREGQGRAFCDSRS